MRTWNWMASTNSAKKKMARRLAASCFVPQPSTPPAKTLPRPISCVSTSSPPAFCVGRTGGTGTSPEMVERAGNRGIKPGGRHQRPQKHRAEMRFLERLRQICRANICPNFSPLLAQRKNLRGERTALLQPFARKLADALVREHRKHHAAGQLARSGRFTGEVEIEPAHHRLYRVMAFYSLTESGLDFGNARFAERIQQLFLASQIIEKSTFADVSRVGDVFDRGLHKAAFGKHTHRGVEQPLADGGRMSLAARKRRRSCGGRILENSGDDFHNGRLLVNIDCRSPLTGC